MSRIFWLILCWAALCNTTVAQPVLGQRNPHQQLAAELVVLAGDVRRLRHENPRPLEARGLEKRLLGGLASLPVALRRAGADAGVVIPLRITFEQRDWSALASRLAELCRRHPFDARPFLRATATEASHTNADRIHHEVCAPCHDNPSTADSLLPPKNLSRQLKSMSQEEFAARLWLGVRGDKMTAYANPFSNQELSALIAWYALPR